MELRNGRHPGPRRHGRPSTTTCMSAAPDGHGTERDRRSPGPCLAGESHGSGRPPSQTLGSIAPKVRNPDTADLWTWLITGARTQLRLAPTRVHRGFGNVRATVARPAAALSPSPSEVERQAQIGKGSLQAVGGRHAWGKSALRSSCIPPPASPSPARADRVPGVPLFCVHLCPSSARAWVAALGRPSARRRWLALCAALKPFSSDSNWCTAAFSQSPGSRTASWWMRLIM